MVKWDFFFELFYLTQSSIEASKEKEEKLLKQWLEYKAPLEQELNQAKLELEKKKVRICTFSKKNILSAFPYKFSIYFFFVTFPTLLATPE